MERMVLGRTGLETYRLGFGGIPIQRVSEAEAVETVRHAVERGVDFIDTSRAYGTSERRIGLALKLAGKEKADRVILASKSHARKADQARVDLETSLKEFDRDYIDLYQCHFVSSDADYSTVTSHGGALETYRKAKEEGLIGHIGISGHSLDVLARAVEDELFDTVMVCFSLIEPEAREKVILRAIEHNIGVIAMKPFSGGVIDNARLALKWTLAEPGVLVIAGVEHPHLFDENWRVFGDGEPLTEEDEREIVALRAGHDKVFCRRCDYCQPCSEGIPIQTVLGIRTMVKRMGKTVLRDSQFWDAINLGRNCTECGECMTRCPYKLPIPELIRENLRWLDEAAEGE